jgi:hypothetical protein
VKVEPLVTAEQVVTTILPEPTVAPAGSGTVICPVLTKVTVAAAPFTVTVVVPDTKLLPFMVMTAPLPAQADEGEKLVIVGAVQAV